MFTGKTQSGFKFCLDEEVLDDYELLETMCDVDSGDTSKIKDVITMMLGQEQKEELKNHVRLESGRVPASKMIEEIMDIFSSSNQGKNS